VPQPIASSLPAAPIPAILAHPLVPGVVTDPAAIEGENPHSKIKRFLKGHYSIINIFSCS